MGQLSRNYKSCLHNCLLTVVTAASIYAEESTTPAYVDDSGQEMVKGLALGFGLFFGIIIVLCVVCCLCCNNSCQCCCCKEKEKPRKQFPRRRVGPSPSPSPPRSGTITRSTMVSGRS